MTRRDWLAAAAAVAVVRPVRASTDARVAIGRCRGYGRELTPVLRSMFDQLGGLSGLVAGKTVAIKMNMVGSAERRFGQLPNEMAHWTNPDVVAATAYLLARSGARRIRVLESFAHNQNPLEEEMLATGWDPSKILNAASNVEMENTGFLGYGKRYHRLMAPDGGLIYPGFDFNHSYAECDVFVSIAKLKEHNT
ncbi:MAG: DUF362 domain-containing protein, partial [bacterium]|nr:DUF362 domain-containing protein [bacterium]